MACWMVISPMIIVFVLIYKLSAQPAVFEESWPEGVKVLGWLIVFFILLMIPVGAIYRVVYRQRKGLPNGKALIQPTSKSGPQQEHVQ